MMARFTTTGRFRAWAGGAVVLGSLVLAITAASGVVRGTVASDGPSSAPGSPGPWARPAIPNELPPRGAPAPPALTMSPASVPTPVQAAPPAPVASRGLARRQTVSLWNVTVSQFEGNLMRAVGERLLARQYPTGVREYLLPTADRQQALVRVEPNGNRVSIEGEERPLQGAVQLVHALDSPTSADGVRYCATWGSREEEVRRLIQAVQLDGSSRATVAGGPGDMLAAATQQEPDVVQQPLPPPAPPSESPTTGPPQPGVGPRGPAGPLDAAEAGRLVGPVQVQVLEGLDAIIIKGRPEDVRRVQDLVQQLVEYSKITEPAIEVVMLKHVDATTLGQLLAKLYQEVYAAREGTMSITPLAAPNALLLIGRQESIQKLKSLVERLDQPVSPTARFQVFRLKHVPAEKAQEHITSFFAEQAQPTGQAAAQTTTQTALAPRVTAVADFRSNTLIVRASPRDLEEVAAILSRLDSSESKSVNEVKVFKLKNASAEVLGPVLRDALVGPMYGQRASRGQGMGMVGGGVATDFEKKSARLQMITVGADGRKAVSSGILTDAQVTADVRSNSLVVTASPDSMPLIAMLIRELDQSPAVEAQVKVFTLRNGDASNMVTMLQNIFATTVTGEEIAVRTGAVPDETSMVSLHFDADVRSNSVIATGSAGSLVVVEALITRLDGSDPRERQNAVYRLKTYNAADVATAVNQYLTNKRTVETSAEGVISEAEQIAREVIVVAEAASNSLIISATPTYFKEIMQLIEDIDQRPAMAVIQVVIAEVALDNFDEFGIELSLEDSILFNRNLATGGLAIPGSIFSNGSETGGQAVTSLGTGQVNSDLSYGGLVLSASSESVSALIRALSTCRRLKVLSRPQIMTLDNKSAQVVVGQKVPYVENSSLTNYGQQNQVGYMDVGLILTVTPRITPDGFVVMEIQATNSKVGPIDEGIPVFVSEGQVIRSPRIDMIDAQTVVSALDGQTVVLGGLIVENDDFVERRVPILSTIPVVGNLFRYEAATKERKELLIIMTPRIVRTSEDAQRIACIEASRIHWCRSDVERLHGGYPGDPFFGPGHVAGPRVIYPDETPTVDAMPMPAEDAGRPEMVPTPDAVPDAPGAAGNPAQGVPEAAGPTMAARPGEGKAQIVRPQWRFVRRPAAAPAGQTPAAGQGEGSAPKSLPPTGGNDVSGMIQPLPAVQGAVAQQGPAPVVADPRGPAQAAAAGGSGQPGSVLPAAYYQGN